MMSNNTTGCTNCPTLGMLRQINDRLANIEKKQTVIENNQLVAKTIVGVVTFLGVLAAWFIDHYNIFTDILKAMVGKNEDK